MEKSGKKTDRKDIGTILIGSVIAKIFNNKDGPKLPSQQISKCVL